MKSFTSQFRKHPKYPVAVSADGDVLVTLKGSSHFWNPSRRPDGYWIVHGDLEESGKPITRRMHRLVLETFEGPCPEGMTARHLDGNPDNNAKSNLKWGTTKEQLEDQKRHGTFVPPPHHRGERNPQYRYGPGVVELVLLLSFIGYSQRTISKHVGVSKTQIARFQRAAR